ncbi:superoxide dismutase [Rapidithrix thailandica]|uniref:Superoxide dismutase n=2 Tax=Rapidithrix thailandica TaxID=413964 RepID=A0AAW9RN83_9BACT
MTMNKREFIKVSGAVAAGTLLNPFMACTSKEDSQKEEETKQGATEFVLPKLAYGFDALEPHIDKMTMEIHHGKHHAGYVRKLNAAIADTKFAGMTLEEIMANVGENDTAVRNNGGGHYNHSLFWSVIAPNAGGQPTGKLAEAITAAFGSFESFQEQFTTAAKTRFGSGWAWLALNAQNQLFISSTPNQDNPLMSNIASEKGTPILGIDVWEHAYYLKYQNLRGDYINSFYNIINWEEVAARFDKAMA